MLQLKVKIIFIFSLEIFPNNRNVNLYVQVLYANINLIKFIESHLCESKVQLITELWVSTAKLGHDLGENRRWGKNLNDLDVRNEALYQVLKCSNYFIVLLLQNI